MRGLVGRLYTTLVQLLISVRNSAEARSARIGGADIIDAKEPGAGALGAVSLSTFMSIADCIAGEVPVTAALGDAFDEQALENLAREFGQAGAAFVKVGFGGIDSQDRVFSLLAAARRGVSTTGAAVVAVAYADHDCAAALSPDVIVATAAVAGVQGVLLDTATKDAAGLLQLIDEPTLSGWVRRVQGNGMIVALAGKLRALDLAVVRSVGADIAGVRGAACDGDRQGRINAGRVRALSVRARVHSPSLPNTGGSAAALG
jgi:(5-formylfuran-3-yl)methyl phosphate synthase